jgi:Spy/CpxP family protein refolding chaperone
MRMSSWKLKAALIISLCFNAAVAGTVAGRWRAYRNAAERTEIKNCSPEETCKKRSHRLAKEIGLCDSKTMYVEREMLKACSAEEGIRERIDRERSELLELFRAAGPDSEAIMNKVDSIASLQSDLEKSIVRKLLRSHSILDPAEREKFMLFIGCSPDHKCISSKDKCPLADSLRKETK